MVIPYSMRYNDGSGRVDPFLEQKSKILVIFFYLNGNLLVFRIQVSFILMIIFFLI